VIAPLFRDVKFGFSLSNPLYDRTKKRVRELEPLAWQILRIHAIKTALPDLPPMSTEDEKVMSSWDEFFQSVSMEELADTSNIEALEDRTIEIVSTNLEVRSAVLMLLYWVQTNHQNAGLDFFRTLEVYNELPNWGAHKLMMLCVMMACNEFELVSADTSAVDAEQLWDRAVKLYREIRSKASRPDANRLSIDGVKRSKVFADLGIKLKFPKGLAKVNLSRQQAAAR
jgi:hypothetical protein